MPSSGIWRRVDIVWIDVSEERRFTQDLQGATSQKTAFFMVTAVKISDRTTINDTKVNTGAVWAQYYEYPAGIIKLFLNTNWLLL
jgi:hypothetical protein